ncbi:hypothetical protein V490_01976 [Pseudogymnoascus sp. VKM F-3557]|nr:hypothetical protein V490_01976 [Pseudogymnoascus sp. VKM F-3557]
MEAGSQGKLNIATWDVAAQFNHAQVHGAGYHNRCNCSYRTPPGAGGIAFKAVVRRAAVDVGDEVVVGQGVRGAREGDGVVEREPAGEANHGVAEADKGAAEGAERRPGAVARRELHEHLLRELGWGPRGPRHLPGAPGKGALDETVDIAGT